MRNTAIELFWNELVKIKKNVPFDQQADAIHNAYKKAKKKEKSNIVNAHAEGIYYGQTHGPCVCIFVAQDFFNENYHK